MRLIWFLGLLPGRSTLAERSESAKAVSSQCPKLPLNPTWGFRTPPILDLGTAYILSQATSKNVSTASAQLEFPLACGPDQPCLDGSCCNSLGKCGYRPEHCIGDHTVTCVSNCDAKAMCGELSKDGSVKCGMNLCCSYYGWCGTDVHCGDHDSQGNPTPCQHGFGRCTVETPPICYRNNGTASNGRKVAYYRSEQTRNRTCNIIWPRDINTTGLTHINFAFAVINPQTFMVEPNHPDDLDLYPDFSALQARGVKTWISIGGWNMSEPGVTAMAWSQMASTKENRAAFILSAIRFMQKFGFQGIDLVWEYPVDPSRNGRDEDTKNQVDLFMELRQGLNNIQGYSFGLSSILPSDYWWLRHMDPNALQSQVDWFNFITYDLHGVWDTLHPDLGPKIRPSTDIREIEKVLLPLWFDSLDPQKINLGLSYYGRGYTAKGSSCIDPDCEYSGPNRGGECTQFDGIMSNSEIRLLIKDKSLQPQMLVDSGIKQITWDDQWVGYDDDETFAIKIAKANERCLGGTFIWSIDYDSGSGTQLVTNSSEDTTDEIIPGFDILLPPTIWETPNPDIQCIPPCTLVFPPFRLPAMTTISWPPLTTVLQTITGGDTSTTTIEVTKTIGSVVTKTRYVLLTVVSGTTATVTTTISVPPLTTNMIEFWPLSVDANDTNTAVFSVAPRVFPPAVNVSLTGCLDTFPPTQYPGFMPSTTSLYFGYCTDGLHMEQIQPMPTVSVDIPFSPEHVQPKNVTIPLPSSTEGSNWTHTILSPPSNPSSFLAPWTGSDTMQVPITSVASLHSLVASAVPINTCSGSTCLQSLSSSSTRDSIIPIPIFIPIPRLLTWTSSTPQATCTVNCGKKYCELFGCACGPLGMPFGPGCPSDNDDDHPLPPIPIPLPHPDPIPDSDDPKGKKCIPKSCVDFCIAWKLALRAVIKLPIVPCPCKPKTCHRPGDDDDNNHSHEHHHSEISICGKHSCSGGCHSMGCGGGCGIHGCGGCNKEGGCAVCPPTQCIPGCQPQCPPNFPPPIGPPVIIPPPPGPDRPTPTKLGECEEKDKTTVTNYFVSCTKHDITIDSSNITPTKECTTTFSRILTGCAIPATTTTTTEASSSNGPMCTSVSLDPDVDQGDNDQTTTPPTNSTSSPGAMCKSVSLNPDLDQGDNIRSSTPNSTMSSTTSSNSTTRAATCPLHVVLDPDHDQGINVNTKHSPSHNNATTTIFHSFLSWFNDDDTSMLFTISSSFNLTSPMITSALSNNQSPGTIAATSTLSPTGNITDTFSTTDFSSQLSSTVSLSELGSSAATYSSTLSIVSAPTTPSASVSTDVASTAHTDSASSSDTASSSSSNTGSSLSPISTDVSSSFSDISTSVLSDTTSLISTDTAVSTTVDTATSMSSSTASSASSDTVSSTVSEGLTPASSDSATLTPSDTPMPIPSDTSMLTPSDILTPTSTPQPQPDPVSSEPAPPPPDMSPGIFPPSTHYVLKVNQQIFSLDQTDLNTFYWSVHTPGVHVPDQDGDYGFFSIGYTINAPVMPWTIDVSPQWARTVKEMDVWFKFHKVYPPNKDGTPCEVTFTTGWTAEFGKGWFKWTCHGGPKVEDIGCDNQRGLAWSDMVDKEGKHTGVERKFSCWFTMPDSR